MADVRYLKQRRQGWYFVMKVPADLVAKVGKSEVVKTLGTRDLSKAQRDRWALAAEWTARFDALKSEAEGRLTPAKIETLAQAAFKETLEVVLADPPHEGETLDTFIDGEMEKALAGGLSELDMAITRARMYAGIGRRAALAGEEVETPTSFLPRKVNPITLKSAHKPRREDREGTPFADASKRYLDEGQRDPAAKITEQTRGQYEAVYRLFDQWAGTPMLHEVTRKQASSFLDVIATLDPLWGRSPDTKKRTFADLFAKYGNHPKGLGNRTINRYASALSMVWQWAGRRGLHEGENPWKDQFRKIAEKRKIQKLPYTTDELKRLLAVPPVAKPNKHTVENTLRWLCLIAAYSGMRLNEICDRKVEDIRESEGVWYFDIKRAKTEAGDRRTPIHSKLIAAGLLDFAKHGEGEWLFPGLKPGGPDAKRSWYISKRFTVYRRELGVVRLDEVSGADRIDFHSFRRTVIQALEQARIPQTEVAQVVGHEREGITFGIYNPQGLGLKALQGVVEAIRYPGLER